MLWNDTLQTTKENTSVQRCIYQITMWIPISIELNVMRLWACLYEKGAISNDNIIIIIIEGQQRLCVLFVFLFFISKQPASWLATVITLAVPSIATLSN